MYTNIRTIFTLYFLMEVFLEWMLSFIAQISLTAGSQSMHIYLLCKCIEAMFMHLVHMTINKILFIAQFVGRSFKVSVTSCWMVDQS